MPGPDPNNREKEIFEHAIEIASPEERASYLEGACGDDTALLERIQALLRASETARDFLPDSPATPHGTIRMDFQPPEQPGDRIGRYKLLQQIGEGGCGVVYMAEQEQPVRRRVALKVIKLGMDTKEVIARFEAERQALALMDHPNIAKVLDAGATDAGRPYFVMELVRGIKITDYCDQNNLSTADRVELFVQVCRAVQHAHQKGIIHRDIKPSNILVTMNDGVPMPKVIDFGIAKATQGKLTDNTVFTAFEQFMGTPAYMSPEQAEMSALDIDTRSDIYSLGVLLYELLTGQTPFDARELLQAGFDEMRRKIRETEPARPSTRLSTMIAADLSTIALRRRSEAPKLIHLVRGDLDWIVMKCLEKDRTRRYETATGLALDLQRHLGNEPVSASPPSSAYRAQKFIRRHRAGVATASLVLLALLAGIVGTTLSLMEALRQKHEAVRQAAIAGQTTEFLTGMFESIDPAQARLREISVREILDQASGKISTAFPNDPMTELPIRRTIMDVYSKLGRDSDALTNAEAAYRLAKSAHGDKDNPETAQSLMDLSDRLDTAGRVPDALAPAQEALAMSRRLYVGDNAAIAQASDTVATRLANLERGEEAISNYEAALAMQQRLFKGDDLAVAKTMENEALCLDGLNRHDEALPKHQAALAMWQRLEPGDHPDVAMVMGGVALCLDAMGHSSDSLPREQETLQMQRRFYGKDHSEVARTLNNLALCYYHLGRYPEALTNYNESLEMCQRMYPGDHQFTAICLDNVAYCLETLGRSAEALPKHQAALAMAEQVYKGDQPEIAKDLNNLALCYLHLGRYPEALTNFTACYEMCVRLFHGDHPHVVLVLNHVADTLTAMGRSDEALGKYQETIAMCRRLDAVHPNDPGVNTTLAIAFGRMGDLLTTMDRSAPAQESYQNGLHAVDDILAASPQNQQALQMRAKFQGKLGTATKPN